MKKPAKPITPCPSTASSGVLKCVLEAGHAGGIHSSNAGKSRQYATWALDGDGRIKVTTFSSKRKDSEWTEDPPVNVKLAAVGYCGAKFESYARADDTCVLVAGHDGGHENATTGTREVEPDEHFKAQSTKVLALTDICPKCTHELGEHDGTKCPKPAPAKKVSKIFTETERAAMAKKEAPPVETTALVRTEEPQPMMLSVEHARAYLAKSCSVDEVRDVADKAKAVALYLRSRDASIESQNDAAEIRLRAERRLGELTAEQPKAKGARNQLAGKDSSGGHKTRPPEAQPPTLAEQGIKKQDAAKWQQLAKIPEKKFEKFVTETKEKGERLTSSAPLKMVRQEAKAKMAEELRAKPIPQVTGRFDIIVIDPPWEYEKHAEDVTQRGQTGYPTMPLEDIKALPVAARAEDNCILWCWTTNAFMRGALECLDAWGFKEKTILTWGKDRMGNGDWLRGKTEHCIMAVKGSPTVTLTNQTTLLAAAVREHSRKPEEFYALVDSLCPGTKIDMFGRAPRDGWVLWGNETQKFKGAAA